MYAIYFFRVFYKLRDFNFVSKMLEMDFIEKYDN
jgi:hypothetical protein